MKEMVILAYIEIRPFLFLGGLPVFVLLAILVCRLARAKVSKGKAAVISSLVFTGLFIFFLSGYGPFVDQQEIREYRMTWEIKPPPSGKASQSEVVLSYVDFPGNSISQYSDDLAQHLRGIGKEQVAVVFEVTSDYGKVRGYNAVEIAGLKTWRSEGSGGGSNGDPKNSPWD